MAFLNLGSIVVFEYDSANKQYEYASKYDIEMFVLGSCFSFASFEFLSQYLLILYRCLFDPK